MPNPAELEAILANHTPSMRAIVAELRHLLRDLVPSAQEAIYPRWQGIGYRHPQAGYLCGIFPQTDHVRLLFEFGVLLPDPDSLLQGEGKQTRHLVIDNDKMIPKDAIQRFIQAALDLPRGKQAKLTMMQAQEPSQ